MLFDSLLILLSDFKGENYRFVHFAFLKNISPNDGKIMREQKVIPSVTLTKRLNVAIINYVLMVLCMEYVVNDTNVAFSLQSNWSANGEVMFKESFFKFADKEMGEF